MLLYFIHGRRPPVLSIAGRRALRLALQSPPRHGLPHAVRALCAYRAHAIGCPLPCACCAQAVRMPCAWRGPAAARRSRGQLAPKPCSTPCGQQRRAHAGTGWRSPVHVAWHACESHEEEAPPLVFCVRVGQFCHTAHLLFFMMPPI